MSTENELKKEISRIQKILDLLRTLFSLQTRLEKIKIEIMIRETAREEGLSKYWEDVLVAVIKAESGLNPKTINRNRNGTTDLGLCQFNDYWYKSVISPYDALNNPEKAVRIMSRMFKEGRQNDWISYRTKSYIRYLTI